MIIVADSSALIALTACEGLPLLDALYGQVRVPEAVLRECSVVEKPYARELKAYLEGKVVAVTMTDRLEIAYDLGPGEVEALYLFRQLSADRLLLDDLRARKAAAANGFKTTGSLGILIAAKQRGLIEKIRPMIDEMTSANIHLSQGLIQQILELAGESL